MLQLPDHITIKTAAPFVIGAYIGVWLIATLYLSVLDSQIVKLKRELSLLANKASKERSLFSLIIWITIATIGTAIAYFAFTYGSTSNEGFIDAMPIAIYIYIAIWTLSFGYLLYIGRRLFKLYGEMQSLSKTIGNK